MKAAFLEVFSRPRGLDRSDSSHRLCRLQTTVNLVSIASERELQSTLNLPRRQNRAGDSSEITVAECPLRNCKSFHFPDKHARSC
jgi:hypothetical protein